MKALQKFAIIARNGRSIKLQKVKSMSKKNKKARKWEKKRLKILKKYIQPSVLTMLNSITIEDLAKLVREINSDVGTEDDYPY